MGIFKRTSISQAEKDLLEKMKTVDPASDEYNKMARSLMILCSAREKNGKNAMSVIGPALGVLGSIAGIVMVIYSEETRILTSKAMNFIYKGRV